MIRRTGVSDFGNRSRWRVRIIGSRGVIVEERVVRNVVACSSSETCGTSLAACGSVGIDGAEIEPAHERSPSYARCAQQVPDVFAAHSGLGSGGIGTDIPERVRIPNQSQRTVGTTAYFIARS